MTQLTMRGNARCSRRKRISRSGVRDMIRPAKYARFSYCAILIPERPYSRHIEIIEAIRRSDIHYRITSHKRGRKVTTRIYLKDEVGLVFVKMLDPTLVWKLFRLVDKPND